MTFCQYFSIFAVSKVVGIIFVNHKFWKRRLLWLFSQKLAGYGVVLAWNIGSKLLCALERYFVDQLDLFFEEGNFFSYSGRSLLLIFLGLSRMNIGVYDEKIDIIFLNMMVASINVIMYASSLPHIMCFWVSWRGCQQTWEQFSSSERVFWALFDVFENLGRVNFKWIFCSTSFFFLLFDLIHNRWEKKLINFFLLFAKFSYVLSEFLFRCIYIGTWFGRNVLDLF